MGNEIFKSISIESVQKKLSPLNFFRNNFHKFRLYKAFLNCIQYYIIEEIEKLMSITLQIRNEHECYTKYESFKVKSKKIFNIRKNLHGI